MVPARLIKLFLQVEPAELFAQHSTEKVVVVSFISKVLLEIHDPRDFLSGKKLWIPSVISSVQLKKKADQFWFLAHSGICQRRSWDASKHDFCLCWKWGTDGLVFYLSLLEWGFRPVDILIFWWWTWQGQQGVNWAPYLLHWAHSHSPPLLWQDTCAPWPPWPSPIHSCHDLPYHISSH